MKSLLKDPLFRVFALIVVAVVVAFILFGLAFPPDAINDIRGGR